MESTEVTNEEVNAVLVNDLANENLRLRQENARLLLLLGKANEQIAQLSIKSEDAAPEEG